MRKAPAENLSRFVKRVIKQKEIKVREVETLSGGKISNGYVSDIMRGKQANPSVDKLLALANGLEIDVHDLLDAALGPSYKRSSNPFNNQIDSLALIDLMEKIVKNPHLAELMQEAALLPPDELSIVLKTAKIFNEPEKKPVRRKKAV